MSQKVLLIGLDCAPPELVFEAFLDDMPNVRRLMETGVYGPLESTIPAITVPAWMSMMTSKDPGVLGFYGIRNRTDRSYHKMAVANSRLVREDTLWDILSVAGRRVVLVGVPQTYPPKPVNGCMITSFLTPSIESQYTYPAELKQEIAGLVGEYMLDVRDFRTENKDDLLSQIYEMTEKRMKVAQQLMRTREWDYFMVVEMGTDRIHHGFWRFMDRTHRKYEPGKYEHAIRDYYRYLDREIGALVGLAGPETAVAVVSDHGAKRIDGGICVNEWLVREGYLKLKAVPERPTPLEQVEVDWDNTVAWGAGGYYARIFLNVKGREPQGVVDPADYERVRDELAERLQAIPDEKGRPIPTQAFKPQEIYRACNGVPPDLIVYFGDLLWRSIGQVGGGAIHTFENDTGPDDANHAQHGIFILNDRRGGRGRCAEGLHLRDVAPTVLHLMGLPVPEDMTGRVITGGDAPEGQVYTAEEEEIIQKRLKDLGYL